MIIKPQDIESKSIVGRLKGKPVVSFRCKGGRHLLFSGDGADSDLLGYGSHPLISRIIAKNQNPDIVFTDLNKGYTVDEATLTPYIDQFTALTNHYQSEWKRFQNKQK